MGKAGTILAVAALLLATVPAAWQFPPVRVQAAPSVSCSSQPIASPMQGHYTGPWHSDGDYHFQARFPAFNGFPAADVDVEMKIIVDGTLDVTVNAGGGVSGSVTGNVDAPIFHDGQQDISSGVGTISGEIAGVFSPTGSSLVLSHPVIDMHWGTFGGHAVETHPVMPDYQFSVAGIDCVSGQGTIAEQGFPVMFITNDNTGQLTQAPGIGTAGGTWQVSSDKAAKFTQLSQQVDDFIRQATTVLSDTSTSLTLPLVDQKIVQPLKSLEDVIRQDPEVSRCLLDRIGAWEATALPPLFARADTLSAGADLVTLRRASDVLRAARLLNLDCAIPENAAGPSVLAGEQRLLDQAIATRSWSSAALLLREIVLLQGDGGRAPLQQELNGDLRSLLESTTGSSGLLAVARIAYALGDEGDAAAAVHRITVQERTDDSKPPWVPVKAKHKKHRKQKKHHTRRPTPTPTPTPAPRSLPQVLAAGVAAIAPGSVAGSPPAFSWRAVPGAARYVLAVTSAQAPALLWSWSGSASSATYGDTSIEGAPSTSDDAWPVPLGTASYTWSVLALDARGQIVGLVLRARP